VPLKFAVVREDPLIESRVTAQTGARAVLLVASGGCTALTLAHRFPSLHIAAFDFNPLQLEHTRTKAEAAARGELVRLNVGQAGADGLNQCGDFERLFRVLKAALDEFVIPGRELSSYFDPDTPDDRRTAMVASWTGSRYWSAAFAVAFNDPLLHAMFGRDATQHAEPGSYPRYFEKVFARGLERRDGWRNPFLQHVLRGAYRAEDAPAYVNARRVPVLELIQGSLPDVPQLERFQVYSLSNVFDWSDDSVAKSWAGLLIRHAPPGAAVIVRQLNNHRNVRRHFEPAFVFDDGLGAELLASDRSLFYNHIEVGFRRP
jgi:S-adenosylmethionine-diacylglycerol 3-amino-3-carboxypropyl transferase